MSVPATLALVIMLCALLYWERNEHYPLGRMFLKMLGES
jgi:hypothetical protein